MCGIAAIHAREAVAAVDARSLSAAAGATMAILG
jgi:hypothetical protein